MCATHTITQQLSQSQNPLPMCTWINNPIICKAQPHTCLSRLIRSGVRGKRSSTMQGGAKGVLGANGKDLPEDIRSRVHIKLIN